MKIEVDEEYRNFCYIQEIKPGTLNVLRMVLCLVLTILTLAIPLILYWKWQRFRNFIHHFIFMQVENDSSEIQHYLIVDSKKFQGKSRNIVFRNHIISPYSVKYQSSFQLHNQQPNSKKTFLLSKYLQHKNLRYMIKNNTLYSLKFKLKKVLNQYLNQGLSDQEVKQSLKIFGKAESFQIKFFQIFNKILHLKALRLIFILFAFRKISFGLFMHSNEPNQVLVSIIILAQVILSLLLMLMISIFGASEHNKIHEKIEENVKYKVVRNGQKIELKLNELSVGDVVVPKTGEIIYFEGLITTNVEYQSYTPYAIVNEKFNNRKDKPIEKQLVLSHLNQISQNNMIHPGSVILNMSFKKEKSSSVLKTESRNKSQLKETNENNEELHLSQKEQSFIKKQNQFFIIVTNNSLLQTYYTAFKENDYLNNCQSIRTNYDTQQLIFQAFFFVFALVGAFFTTRNKKIDQHFIDVILSMIILCFPYNMALFTSFSQVLSIIRLKNNEIHVVNPMIEQIAIADKIFIESSAFEATQFTGYIKKQRCARMALPQKFENSTQLFDIFRKAKQQSIFTFLGWVGMMNIPYFGTDPLYQNIFDQYDFTLKQKSEYEEDEELHPRVQNKDTTAIKINWKLIQHFLISQKFIQAVLIQDLYSNRFQNKFFAILQGEYTSEQCEDYFDEVVDEVGRDQYRELMKRLHIQGKRVKYISLKRFVSSQKNPIKIQNIKLKNIEQKPLFGGFLVFDEWPTEQNMIALIELDNLNFYKDNLDSGITIFSVRQRNALVGYDHILRNAKILFQQQSKQRTEEIYLTKSQYQGVLHIGNGILDRGSLLNADVSINKISQSYAPADFQIIKPQKVIDLLYEGIWSLYMSTITIVCLVMFNFSKILGQLILFLSKIQNKIETQPLSMDLDKIFLIDVGALIIPIILLNAYEPNKKLIKKDHRKFFKIELMFHVFISMVGLLVLYTIEFLDHGFQGSCGIYQQYTNLKHEKLLRSHFSSMEESDQSCENIIYFINISFALLVVLLVDRQSDERKARNIFIGLVNKLYMFIVWYGSIFYLNIATNNVFRSITVVIVLTFLVYVSQFIKSNGNKEQQQKFPSREAQTRRETDQF